MCGYSCLDECCSDGGEGCVNGKKKLREGRKGTTQQGEAMYMDGGNCAACEGANM